MGRSDYTVRASGDTGRGLAEITSSILCDINDELDAEAKEVVRVGAAASRRELRANSPKLTGEYARDWGCEYSDKGGHHTAVVRNKSHYQITHLLEDGHESRNQYGGPYGTVKPAKPEHHIERAMEVGLRAIDERLGAR